MKHYAASVTYTIDYFLEKNKDNFSPDLEAVLIRATNVLVMAVMGEKYAHEQSGPTADILNPNRDRSATSSCTSRPAGLRRATDATPSSQKAETKQTTVSAKFKEQLAHLIGKIGMAKPHYIRCIKPNSLKVPNEFEPGNVTRQLRSSGVLEALKIRKAGFPVRMDFELFVARFRPCVPSSATKGLTALDACHRMAELLIPSEPIAVGHTKVFLSSAQSVTLEASLRERLRAAAEIIVQWMRYYCAKCRYMRMRKAICVPQRIIKCAVAHCQCRAELELAHRNKAASALSVAMGRLVARRRHGTALHTEHCTRAAAEMQRHVRCALRHQLLVEEIRQQIAAFEIAEAERQAKLKEADHVAWLVEQEQRECERKADEERQTAANAAATAAAAIAAAEADAAAQLQAAKREETKMEGAKMEEEATQAEEEKPEKVVLEAMKRAAEVTQASDPVNGASAAASGVPMVANSMITMEMMQQMMQQTLNTEMERIRTEERSKARAEVAAELSRNDSDSSGPPPLLRTLTFHRNQSQLDHAETEDKKRVLLLEEQLDDMRESFKDAVEEYGAQIEAAKQVCPSSSRALV